MSGDRDAFTSGDLVLRRALGGMDARAASARAERWRPFRAYALSHLWVAERVPSARLRSPLLYSVSTRKSCASAAAGSR